MTNGSADNPKRELQPGARKFYDVGPSLHLGRRAGFKVENIELLLQGRPVLGAPSGRRGFPDYPEPPRVLIDKSLGRRTLDLEQYHEYWLISGRAKSVFETVDPQGFAFVRCQTRFAGTGGSVSPEYWLCDVVSRACISACSLLANRNLRQIS